MQNVKYIATIISKISKYYNDIPHYIWIGNNYINIIYLGIIFYHFSVIDTFRRIGLFICVIYRIQKLCLLHF